MFKTRLHTVGNDFGHLWNFEFFLIFFEIFRRLHPPWNSGKKLFFRKKFHKTCSKQVWTILGTILRISAILKFLWFFRKFSMTPWNTGQKNVFEKIAPKHVWTLGNVFGHFRNFETVLIFSLIFSKSLPQNLSPENWTQNFQVRKTEFIFLSSGIWTHNFKSRTSEVELRILTVARMQRECLLSIVS